MPGGHVGQDCERYRALVEASPDGILLCRDSLVVFTNTAAARLFAVPREQVAGRSLFDLFHETSHAAIRAEHDLLRSAPIDAKIMRADGTVLDVEMHAAALGSSDTSDLQVILRDITRRKRAEAAVRE